MQSLAQLPPIHGDDDSGYALTSERPADEVEELTLE